ncbi:acyl-CoA dehydrogenase family protein [Dactylosporangium sp. NPDC049742]|uniref:acyl-CoA dehydrogenase family protein n=1 Tax=Dactylosporangium sp. NPDC049742 TaxID=3154737 RepID=UPI003442C57D
MRFALTEDQTALRDAVRAPLAAGGWSTLADLGVFAAMADLGLDETDLVPVLEEVGYAAVALPVTATAFVAVPLLAALDDDRAAAAATGSLRIAVAGPGGLTPFGGQADLVLHLDGGVARIGGPSTAASTVDTSLDAVVSMAAGVLTDEPALVEAAAGRAALGHAAELVGLGRRMLDLTVGYVQQRYQFGAPVGSFQAVKHQLADAYLGLEFARPAVLAAAWALQEGADAGPAVDGAVVLAADAAHAASRAAIQCHGAIGYTVEYELHRFAKRAWALAALAGPGGRLAALATTIGLKEQGT